MKFITRIGLLTILLSILFFPVGRAQTKTGPVETFEQVWQIFDTNYPYFGHSGIDWNVIGRIYRPRVTEKTTDEELFRLLSEMLGHLNDSHVNLDDGKRQFNAGITAGMKKEDFSIELIRRKYLQEKFITVQDGNIIYGWIGEGIGYVYIKWWKRDRMEELADAILLEFKEARGIIIDVRNNGGGNGFAPRVLASRFAGRKQLFAKEYLKRGPAHDSLLPPSYIYLEPGGPAQFAGPVAVLQNRFSESASECFLLAMRVLPRAASIGESSSGCGGMYYPHRLANGWSVGLAWSYDTDQSGRCWVGTGVTPNIRMINTKEEIAAEKDKVLEFAADLLRLGGWSGREIPESFSDMRISLFELFLERAKKDGVAAARAEAERRLREEPGTVYFSALECLQGSRGLLQERKLDELAAIFELAAREWPDVISVQYILGQVYNKQGRAEQAAAAYRTIAGRQAYFPWEMEYVARAKEYLARQ